MMYVDKETRDKLSALTLELFKRKNLWTKMLARGFAEPVKEDADTLAKYGKFGPRRRLQTHKEKKRPGGAVRMTERKHYTPETLLVWLQDLKKNIDDIKAKREAEQKAINEAAQSNG